MAPSSSSSSPPASARRGRTDRRLRCGTFGRLVVEAHDRQDRGARHEGPLPRHLAPDRVRCKGSFPFDGLSIARRLDLHSLAGVRARAGRSNVAAGCSKIQVEAAQSYMAIGLGCHVCVDLPSSALLSFAMRCFTVMYAALRCSTSLYVALVCFTLR